jgi:hypothetical protein
MQDALKSIPDRYFSKVAGMSGDNDNPNWTGVALLEKLLDWSGMVCLRLRHRPVPSCLLASCPATCLLFSGQNGDNSNAGVVN